MPGEECVTDPDEITAALIDLQIMVPILNQYFDTAEYTYGVDPIKTAV
jgi:hypothetical protein